jgi:hypothetical protein
MLHTTMNEVSICNVVQKSFLYGRQKQFKRQPQECFTVNLLFLFLGKVWFITSKYY